MEGRYRILDKLGEGGVGVVYKAQDTLLDKTVAIKKIQANSNATDVIRFQKEAKLAGALVHPNILGVIDFGMSKDNSFYLVLNFIEGESLSALLKRTDALPLFEALDIFIQIARGLAHAHKHKVIHRDIKPSNVMLVDDGTGSIKASIVDFGLAKTLEQDQSLTNTGVGVGTPRYMSPEQIRADREIGPATDVYSMGCLMFESLVGKPAFHGDNVMQTLQMHLNDDVPDLNSVGDLKFPDGIVEIIDRCLQKDANDRYASGEELLEQLTDLLEQLQTSINEPLDASRPSPKVDATAGDGSSQSGRNDDTPLNSKITAFVRKRFLVIAAVLLSTGVLLLFAVPIISSIGVDSDLVRVSSTGFNFRFNPDESDSLSRKVNNYYKLKKQSGGATVREEGEHVISIDDDTRGMSAVFDSPDSRKLERSIRALLPEDQGSELEMEDKATSVQGLKKGFAATSDSAKQFAKFEPAPPKMDKQNSSIDETPILLSVIPDGNFQLTSSGKFWAVFPNDGHVRKLIEKQGPKVHKIQFRSSTVSGAGYALLKACPLTFLEFENTAITSEVLTAIGNLPDLITVAFKMCPEIDFSHFNELNRLKQFHELIIEGSTLTKSDVSNIAKVQFVDQLKLDNCKGLTRDNLLPLLKLPRLGVLHLMFTDFDDRGFEVLKKLHLSDLVLTGTRITKVGLASYLKAVGKTPMHIDVSLNDSITTQELEKLRASHPNFVLNQVKPKIDTDVVFHIN